MLRNKRTILLISVLALAQFADVANADYFFGAPTNLGSVVNSSANEAAPSVSADGLSLLSASTRSGGLGSWGIWVATRATTDDEWGAPVYIGATVSSSAGESTPNISTDGLSLYFSSLRSGGFDIWMTTRPTTDDDWGAPVKLGPPVNTSSGEGYASISVDGLELYFWSDRPGGYSGDEIWLAKRETKDGTWSEPVNLGPPVNSPSLEASPNISSDGLMLLFQSNRPGGYGGVDIWVTRRRTTEDAWGTPVNLGPGVNTSDNDLTPYISSDGSTLYFSSWSSGGFGGNDLWQVSIDPVVDLNGDGIVNSGDMTVIVNHWGEDYPSCDIGPMPWGDGIVDVEDLIVLSEHLFEYVDDPTLVAHWPLDEVEGSTAHDSINDNDDIVMGGALWQPTGGVLSGALELDGVDDCLIATFGVNPADPEMSSGFTIFAWIKGGAPGQVVISEPMGDNWLMADADGKLMTELKGLGQDAGALLSEAIFTDGAWHRIGLVWDGSHRALCVDGVTVAEDTQDGLGGSNSGLYIGVGKDYALNSLFAGMIDDVRIYNRAVTP